MGHRLLTMAQIAAAASLAVHVPAALGTTSAGFALSYAAVRFLLVAEYLRAGRHIPSVRPLTGRYAAGFGAAASLWAVSTLFPAPWRFGLWGVALAADFLTPLTAGQLHVRFPPHLMIKKSSGGRRVLKQMRLIFELPRVLFPLVIRI